MSRSPALVAVSAAAFLSFDGRGASAQSILREHLGGIGFQVAGLRDLDGDGVNDYAFLSFEAHAQFKVRSGASGARLLIVGDPRFGVSDTLIRGTDDLDGDGVPDLLVGIPSASDPNHSLFECGDVLAISGADAHVLLEIYGSASNDALGSSVANVGDVNGDGISDFVAGATQFYSGPSGGGYLRCYSGADGTILYEVDGAHLGDGLGTWATALSDHDGDGVRDLAVFSAPGTWIGSGATGATLATIPPPPGSRQYGSAEVDDLDGDGEPEIAIGGVDFASEIGAVRVISIPTQTERRVHFGDRPYDCFGLQLTTISDADGDGVRDYLVGSPTPYFSGSIAGPGSASLFSGRTGERLDRFVDPVAPDSMGMSIADAGDLDGDGFAEMIVGSPDHSGDFSTGAVFVYRGNDLWLNAEPRLPAAGDTESLIVHGAPAGNPVALFLTDVNGTPLVQLLSLGTSDAVESFTLQGTVPSGLAGTTMTFHAYALDANSRVISSANETVDFQ
jgi:hypothetical protein